MWNVFIWFVGWEYSAKHYFHALQSKWRVSCKHRSCCKFNMHDCVYKLLYLLVVLIALVSLLCYSIVIFVLNEEIVKVLASCSNSILSPMGYTFCGGISLSTKSHDHYLVTTGIHAVLYYFVCTVVIDCSKHLSKNFFTKVPSQFSQNEITFICVFRNSSYWVVLFLIER